MIGRTGQSANEATSVGLSAGVDAAVVDAEIAAPVCEDVSREELVLDTRSSARDTFSS
jgi:hypothetical protein